MVADSRLLVSRPFEDPSDALHVTLIDEWLEGRKIWVRGEASLEQLVLLTCQDHSRPHVCGDEGTAQFVHKLLPTEIINLREHLCVDVALHLPAVPLSLALIMYLNKGLAPCFSRLACPV